MAAMERMFLWACTILQSSTLLNGAVWNQSPCNRHSVDVTRREGEEEGFATPAVSGSVRILHSSFVGLNAASTHSWNVKQRLQLPYQLPFIVTDVRPVEFLQGVYGSPRQERVQSVGLFELSAIEWLVRAFDFDGDRRLTFLDQGNVLVVPFNRSPVSMISLFA